MTANHISILIGACLATLVFKYGVSGRSDVTLGTWRGILVFFLLGMGAIHVVRIAVTLLGTPGASP